VSDLITLWLAFPGQWAAIGRDCYRRMFGARLRGGRYVRLGSTL